MALQFEVCQSRESSYSASANNSGGKKSCTQSISLKFLVKASDPLDPDFDGTKVTDTQVAFASGIPIVNYHTYYDSIANVSIPMAVCKSKSVTRRSAASTVFDVTCQFATEPGKQGEEKEQQPQSPPVDADDITPVITYGMTEIVRVVDSAPAFSATAGLGRIGTAILPVDQTADQLVRDLWGEQFDQPVTARFPAVSMTITQFESAFSYTDILDRGYKVNADAWGTDAVKKAWMIVGINAVEQSVQTSTGPVDMYRVTYELSRNDYEVVDHDDNTLFVGHAAALPLYSERYVNAAGTAILEFKSKGLPFLGKVDAGGRKIDAETPDYVRYDTVDERDFDTIFPNASPS